ncbi:uncharacterized protein LOC129917846 [Episyrphus balteatus]|uniref:uncharacterized protein LOC129917846 n=1 Tax=Episyrphus balteatus TaxID=286459 RepID=UPI002484F467|nr:uncharacterized protein LOC129917846 [Episyrphus balteatus]XP_055854015.1 uncharacterized protein LOC129917846 [Episyrphus balteatus]
MPTCDNKSKLTSSGNPSAAEPDHHASEAAKVKRTKEQAYFNSYDFDAIEVLPYDEDEVECPKKQHQHPHGCHSTHHHYPKYSVGGGCEVCHHLSQSPTAASSSALGSTQSGVSHNLKSPSHHQQPQSQQQLKSKKKKESTSSHSSSTSSSSFSHPSNPSDAKRTYLKRIGAFLTSHSMGKRSSIETLADIEKQAKCCSSSSQVSLNNRSTVAKLFEGKTIVDDVAAAATASGSIKRDHVIDEAGNGNFLLPRAMLKYQNVAFGNSMPLAVISNLGGSSTSLMGSSSISGQPNQVTNSSIKSKSKPIPVESSISATDTAVSINNNNNNKQKPQLNLIASKSAAENSGFVSSSSSASASSSSFAKSTLTTSSLSAAESSIIIGETSANVDVSGTGIASTATAALACAPVAVASKSITNPNVVSSITSDLQQSYNEKLVSSSSSSSTSANVAIIGVGSPNGSNRSIMTKTNTGSGDATISAGRSSSGRGARERTSSQSHYSTDKSGSSGYYSSNVCSTYSVEDHIYCEPTIDILEVNKPAITKSSQLGHTSNHSHRQIMIVHNSDDDDEDHHHHHHRSHLQQDHQRHQKTINQNLRILETSIENLDRHLKSYPKLSNHDRLAVFARTNNQQLPTHLYQVHNGNSIGCEAAKTRYGHLPTIMEGGGNDLAACLQKSWQDEIAEDSLLDIDLDSFLLTNERNKEKSAVNGIDNPTFDKSVILHDEDMENHYKCAKYINSCPEDAYRLESEVGNSLDHFLKKYDDQIHFQNTRELLEDVRDKIRLLSESSEATITARTGGNNNKKNLPHELDTMIKALKGELESYLERMNHHSEMEIRQLCTGLVKNQNIVRMKKAFERRKSNASDSEFDFAYEAIRDGTVITVQHTQQHIETTSIRCSSDPNFKMKRRSLCDVFPKTDADCYAGTSTATMMAGGGVNNNCGPSVLSQLSSVMNDNSPSSVGARTQLQRNLSFHKPVLNKLDGEANDDGEKDSAGDWHQKKPSNWEMYYGTNRLNQTLLGKRGVITNGNQAIMSYPSSRPESDFTLDLPRAEQLRIKMEKEKKFRRRCRYLTTFLSLVFFLLTVMVVSLVLTRGKRMFGSMI